MAGAAGPQLQLHGERTSGQDVRQQNATAVQAVANILKTSLGPVGLDKVRCGQPAGRPAAPSSTIPSRANLLAPPPPSLQMLVDDIGDVTITNDGATILKLLEVEHPAAKVRAAAGRRRQGAGAWEECAGLLSCCGQAAVS